MRKQEALKAIHQLLTRPFFTAVEAKGFGVSAAHLGYYVKTGKIKRLGRGIYQGVDYKTPSKNFRWEELIDTVNSIPGGVICLISALTIYDITDEIPRKHWIAVSHNTSIKRRASVKILRLRDIDLGKTKACLGGVQVSIFDRERTIIDTFRLLSRETAIKALKMALSVKGDSRLDLRKLQTYAKKLRFNIAPLPYHGNNMNDDRCAHDRLLFRVRPYTRESLLSLKECHDAIILLVRTWKSGNLHKR